MRDVEDRVVEPDHHQADAQHEQREPAPAVGDLGIGEAPEHRVPPCRIGVRWRIDTRRFRTEMKLPAAGRAGSEGQFAPARRAPLHLVGSPYGDRGRGRVDERGVGRTRSAPAHRRRRHRARPARGGVHVRRRVRARRAHRHRCRRPPRRGGAGRRRRVATDSGLEAPSLHGLRPEPASRTRATVFAILAVGVVVAAATRRRRRAGPRPVLFARPLAGPAPGRGPPSSRIA